MTEKPKNIQIRFKNKVNQKTTIVIEDEPEIKKQLKVNDNNENIQNDIAPWLNQKTSKIKHPTIRFHNEIIDFYYYIFPSEEEHTLRKQAYERVQKILKECHHSIKVEAFGSFRTRLYLPNADIDIAIIDEELSSKQLYKCVAQKIMSLTNKFENVNLVTSAKVPIIKFIESESHFSFDLSFNQMDGLKQLDEIQKAFEIYPEFKYLIMILKCILKQRDLSETYSGGIGSFLLFQMILAFLREYRKDAKINNKIDNLKNVTLGEYLLKFLEFYGTKFDIQKKRIIMLDGGSIVNKPQIDDKFSLISPQDPEHDIGSSSFKIKEIFKIFQNRYNFLMNYNFKPEESVLKYLINPSDQRFTFIKN